MNLDLISSKLEQLQTKPGQNNQQKFDRSQYFWKAPQGKSQIRFVPFKENKENILETLEEYIQNLERFKELMEADNFDEVFQTMENTNHIKTILKGIE